MSSKLKKTVLELHTETTETTKIKVGDTVKVKGIYYSPEMVVDYIDTDEHDEVFVALVWFSIHNVLQNDTLALHLLEKVKARHD